MQEEFDANPSVPHIVVSILKKDRIVGLKVARLGARTPRFRLCFPFPCYPPLRVWAAVAAASSFVSRVCRLQTLGRPPSTLLST